MEIKEINRLFSSLGVKIPDILLPNKSVDYTKWSVVACDQFTSNKPYWDKVASIVGGNPSTFKITLPEIFLEETDKEQRIKNINNNMQEYTSKNIFTEHKNSFILVDRKTSRTQSRKGLIVALDLEAYDFNKGSQTLIRATEGTIIDRLPPRIKIRENASIELPHIMVLIDDPDKSVIEPLFEDTEELEKVYDFELMQNGGHIKGYKIDKADHLQKIFFALEKLANKEFFLERYGLEGNEKNYGLLLFAMGDGNHSFATAKAIWEDVKKDLSEEDRKDHPARFALVELVNVHDEGLAFEPIHRVVFGCADDLLESAKSYFASNSMSIEITNEYDTDKENGKHKIPFITENEKGTIIITNPIQNLEVGTLQGFLDEYIKQTSNKLDYIHGEKEVEDLSTQNGSNNIGFLLPSMEKSDLFKTVILDGALPRKTFSMGEADEKRYYLEARKIK